MKCTECGKVVKPVVAIDIDGTLGDFHGHFLAFAARYLGASVDDYYNGIGSFKEWFCSAYGVDFRTWHDIKLAYRQGAQKRSMPYYGGARELCALVRSRGAELWLTTTRPYLRLDNIDPDTRAWLDRHGIEYDGLVYDELKYERLAEIVEHDRVTAIVDDLFEMCFAAGKVFGDKVPILRRTRYNRGVPPTGFEELKQLEDIKHNIMGRIEGWYIRHGDARLHPDAST